MPRSKDPTPQASLFDGTETAADAPPPRLSSEQLVRLIVADVARIRKVLHEMYPLIPPEQEPDK